MEAVPESISFPKTEEAIIEFWDRIDAFQTSLKLSEGRPSYSFYDGPPFATGLPHYGHILAGTIKDTVTRYAHQTGHHVPRKFGWDTHGLPIEFEIDKDLGIKTREDVLKLGIRNYNQACRSIVLRYAKEWESTVKRTGRWIDFQNGYMTMSTSYMESEWWACKRLFDLNLVYRGYKVMPFSTGCKTPLSNFESNLNYKDTSDPSVVVSFPLVEDPQVKLLAWTTTPWTLPSNLALCVSPNLTYIKIIDKKTKETYILCETRLTALYKNPGKNDYELVEKIQGKDLAGKKYQPIFDYFVEKKGSVGFKVLLDDYVRDDSGTGIVHQAPAFGEDDFRVCLVNGVISTGEEIPCPVDSNGNFTAPVQEFLGQYVKDADKEIKKVLKDKGRLIRNDQIVHSYPFCWRSETPLIYKIVPCWFVAVEKFKANLLVSLQDTYWVPSFVKEKRFQNWLNDAKDWAISRNRFWGTPIPIWVSDDGVDKICIGSLEELEKLTGERPDDIHRENIDHLTIPSPRGPEFGVLKRTEEVFDCWFESGSMPFAQFHYPFENKDLFERTFPADFVAEGLDQTRGWFYTLLVISTALFGKSPYKNLICNGLILAQDGKKMSKRLKNYPLPTLILDTYGADALRLYLISSPVVRAEPLKFAQEGVFSVIKDVLLPWFNAYRFLVQSVHFYESSTSTKFQLNVEDALSSKDIMDRWVLSESASLVSFVKKEMKDYRLYTVVPRLLRFIEQLTNWYVRFNRKRLRGRRGWEEARVSINCLFEVLYTITRMMAPFSPFFSEYLYQNLKRIVPDALESIHYLMFPEVRQGAINTQIEENIASMQSVIVLGRLIRDKCKLPLKNPLKELIAVVKPGQEEGLNELKHRIIEEMNVLDVIITSDEKSFIAKSVSPIASKLGKSLRKDAKPVFDKLSQLTDADVNEFIKNQKIEILGHTITLEDVDVVRGFKGDKGTFEAEWDKDLLVVVHINPDASLQEEGFARQVINHVQKLRKKSGIQLNDPIEVFFEAKNELAQALLKGKREGISQAIGVAFVPEAPTAVPVFVETQATLPFLKENIEVQIRIRNLAHTCHVPSLLDIGRRLNVSSPEKFAEHVQSYVASRSYSQLATTLATNGTLDLHFGGQTVSLLNAKHIFSSASQRAQFEDLFEATK
eukprot:TRINITY_DN7596_c0_g1_i1.p1 TRINITY_DN7596_c0_g1~~TRINITY_DN7596_c0_g1_i1.p1  ORF type:complete len:1151 (-),score=290.53 TRINITY_DN7596_c0_g1_i1:51-3503(-)